MSEGNRPQIRNLLGFCRHLSLASILLSCLFLCLFLLCSTQLSTISCSLYFPLFFPAISSALAPSRSLFRPRSIPFLLPDFLICRFFCFHFSLFCALSSPAASLIFGRFATLATSPALTALRSTLFDVQSATASVSNSIEKLSTRKGELRHLA